MSDPAKKLAAIELVDDGGAPVVVRSAWERGPVLLVFIRHFG
ncbi:MAG: hypothetical protein P1V51_00885 [Deltaproteobacteria bacterium]|nr:hypothetical protein [Deltaproteobacteria bacterium]